MTRHRTVVLGLVAVVLVITLPGLVLTISGRDDLAGMTAMAAVAGVLPALMVGPRMAVVTAVGLGASAAAAVAVTDQPWLAALLMAAAAGAVGLSSRVSAQRALATAPITLAFLLAEPPRDLAGEPVAPLVIGAAMLGAALWAALAVSVLMRSRHRRELETLSWYRAGAYAVVLAVAVGGASWFLVDLQLGHGGAWFVMTLLIVLQPYLKDSWQKTVQRASGTVIGFVIALVLYAVFDVPAVLYVIASVLMLLALVALVVKHRPYWQFVALLTPAIVLLEGGSGSVVDTALARLGFTLLGVAVAVAIELAAVPILRSVARRHPADHA